MWARLAAPCEVGTRKPRMNASVLHRVFLTDTPPRKAGARLWVAFSGGLDSSVLLHLMAQRKIPDLHAVHVHHGLQAAAESWMRHCQAQCAQWRVPLRVLRVQVQDEGSGLEAAARLARYEAIRALMKDGDVLLTAHHREDQAETLLLRLLRGSGVRGLAAMRGLTPFMPGQLWRPLLKVPRRELRAYADAQGLRWIEDPHNADLRFARSLLRAKIMPRLSERWPHAAESFGRAADACADASLMLDELADADLHHITGARFARLPPPRSASEVFGLRTDIGLASARADAERDLQGEGHALHIPALLALSGPRRRNLLIRWVAHLGLPLPYAETLSLLDQEVLLARADADPCLAWPGGEFRRYRERLYALPRLAPAPDGIELSWDGREPLQLPSGCGCLELDGTPPASPWQVRFAGGGERMRPIGAAQRRTLKNLFQERAIPPWVRVRTPLLFDDSGLRWVGGLGFSEPPLTNALVRWQTGIQKPAVRPELSDQEE